ncbi:MAG: sigma-70 family RNA polymerase sigma factor [Candidatus Levybacteria bacterium]|nr:sigma-70 family RNA polymerase sigma factor [Candidatus Levybacteria bacterium]
MITERVAGNTISIGEAADSLPHDGGTLFAQYESLYESDWEAVVRYCERLGSSDPENAAQYGFTKAYNALPALRAAHPSSMKGWIYKITRNVVWDELRSRRLEVTRLGERIASESYEVFNICDHQELPMDVAVNNVTGDELFEMLRTLPGKQGPAILLYSQGYSYREIAEILHTTRAAIKQQIFRGRIRMRQLLSSELASA